MAAVETEIALRPAQVPLCAANAPAGEPGELGHGSTTGTLRSRPSSGRNAWRPIRPAIRATRQACARPMACDDLVSERCYSGLRIFRGCRQFLENKIGAYQMSRSDFAVLPDGRRSQYRAWQMEDRTSTGQKGPPLKRSGGLRERVDSVL